MPKKAVDRKAERKIKEALKVLELLGFPRQQLNERSAMTLLSLLGLKPKDTWSKASDPLMGITPMMEFFATHYGKQYKPNTRETVRRQTVHQFVQAALVIQNPDKPSRPTNSPKAVYQIEPSALKLLRDFNSSN
jgi:adenine-specific DNA-methyltransferase